MKKMCLNNRVVAFILLTSLGSLGIAYATDLTGGTGVINGTAPVIYNGKNEPDRVDFSREYNNVDEGEELDIADKIELTWKVTDAEGDQEITLPTVEWICTDASSNKHVLATAINEYVIHPADKGCTIALILPRPLSPVFHGKTLRSPLPILVLMTTTTIFLLVLLTRIYSISLIILLRRIIKRQNILFPPMLNFRLHMQGRKYKLSLITWPTKLMNGRPVIQLLRP